MKALMDADAIERQLAHVDNDRVRRSYARAEYWDERVKMMAWWAEKAEALRSGERLSKHLKQQAIEDAGKTPKKRGRLTLAA